MISLTYSLTVFLLLWTPISALSATTVSANITSDTTWSTSGSPYEITKTDFEVEQGSTLTIQPGVTAKFADRITVEGALVANGTEANPIILDELTADNGWGYLYFTHSNCADPTQTNTLSYVQIRNFDSDISISAQNLTMTNSTLTMNGSIRLGLRSWNREALGCDATSVQLDRNTIHFTSTFEGALSKASIIHLDGVTSSVTNNTITGTYSEQVSSAKIVHAEVTNTQAFVATVTGNTMILSVGSSDTLSAYGIWYEDFNATGVTSNNVITVSAPRSIYGIKHNNTSEISYNQISLSSNSSASFGNLYGIQTSVSNHNCDDLAIGNSIQLYGNHDDRAMYGIELYGGKARNNRIALSNIGAAGGSGKNIGIQKTFYSACIESNTILVSATDGVSNQGMLLSNATGSNTITVKNNIVLGDSGSNSTGIYGTGDSTKNATYNLVNGFNTRYSGVTEGTGSLSTLPFFSTPRMTLASNSPGVDEGDPASSYSNEPSPNGSRINLGAWGNTSSATGLDASNTAPDVVELLSPADGSEVATSLTLKWRGAGDVDGDSVTYLVYHCKNNQFIGCEPTSVTQTLSVRYHALAWIPFAALFLLFGRLPRRWYLGLLAAFLIHCGPGLDGPPSTVTEATFGHDLVGLTAATTYYWKVVSVDSSNAVSSTDVRSFTTTS